MKPFFNFHFHSNPPDLSINKGLYNFIVNADTTLMDTLKDKMFFSAGIHPQFINNPNSQIKILEMIINHHHCLAIGECGLDKRVKLSEQIQRSIFINQIKLSLEIKKPLIIHNVGRTFEILSLLKQHHFNLPFVFHGFNLKSEIAFRIIEQGGYLSLGKALLNNESNASKTIKLIPLEKLILETDNEPILIEEIYQKAAFHLQMELIHLKKRTDPRR